MGSSTATPGQGYQDQHPPAQQRQQRQRQQTQTPPLSPSSSFAPDSPSTPRAATTLTTAPTSRATSNPRLSVDRRDALYAVGPASPPKNQSPLRQSTTISYQDHAGRPDLPPFLKPRHNTKLPRGHSRSRSEVANSATTSNTNSNIPLPVGQAPETLPTVVSTPRSLHSQDHQNTPTRRTSLGEVGQDRRVSTRNDSSNSSSSNTTAASPSSPSSVRSSALSFIASRMPAMKALAPAPVVVSKSDDELLNLNIEASLFPNGAPPEGQAFSPAAFKNLQQTATGLLKNPAPPGPPSRTSTFGGAAPAASRVLRGSQPPQMSTFQKLFKGISGDPNRDINGCRNCQGQDASIAWDTVGLLKAENKTLKERVSELEVAVEEVLDVVNGVGQ
ncbi:hypothetical protein M440DRAFT_1393341 [Trichoderma longibrachiatum ATCC 18648]|uniref:Uncharacterized protein n=1 Tax=Trichoderma longibrachiatum ATCC 18648 TaxID=983965 RepID=A0A2T4BY20_TRILO|nr:hypothetical protein M440DRAFT_1393341 [Trichoderma longibrachiatum ATCC 18648]